MSFQAPPSSTNSNELVELVKVSKLKVVIDSVHAFDKLVDALNKQMSRTVCGAR
jgi:hypothetical protein